VKHILCGHNEGANKRIMFVAWNGTDFMWVNNESILGFILYIRISYS
jgi:hypothetical protein